MENDASKVGWGAYAHSNSFTQGKWSITEAKLLKNSLELFSVLPGTKALFPGSSITSLMILCDNISAVNYIYRMGGTKSCANSLVLRDYSLSQHWAKKQILPWFRYIRPDTMSRVFLDNHKYFLSHTWSSHLHSQIDFCLDFDLFAVRILHHLSRSSRLHEHGAEYIDDFFISLVREYFYIPTP